MSPPAPGRPREFDPQAALEAAMLVFWQKGYEGTGVAEICQAMGIGKQSMYDWVGDKKGLYIACVQHYAKTRICGLQDHLESEGSPLANIRHCLHAMADYAKSDNCIGCLLTNTQGEFGASDPDIAAVAAESEAFIVQAFTDVLERARDAGEIAPSVDARAVASAIAVLRNGLMIAGRAQQSAESIDRTIDLLEGMIRPT
ncbi:MAG: TetR/AcrR family transcriptional regulator [Planctomycetota bacterium]